MQIYTTKTKLASKNRGGTLVEMIFVIAVSAMLLPVATKICVIAIREIPLEQKLIMTNSDKNKVLYNIQQDIESAPEVLAEFAQYKTDPNNLLIKKNDNAVTVYRIEKNGINKILLTESSTESIDSRPLPNAKISFTALMKDDKIYAVKVSSYMEQKLLGRTNKKMKMENLYFVNSMQKELYK